MALWLLYWHILCSVWPKKILLFQTLYLPSVLLLLLDLLPYAACWLCDNRMDVIMRLYSNICRDISTICFIQLYIVRWWLWWFTTNKSPSINFTFIEAIFLIVLLILFVCVLKELFFFWFQKKIISWGEKQSFFWHKHTGWSLFQSRKSVD